MAKKYYWLKLKNNFFTQPRIKKLRKIAGGDTYTIIYLKMQLLSIQNGGKLFYEGIEDDFIEELALTIDEDSENVAVTVNFLLSQGLLKEETTNEFALPEAQESIGSETDSAGRMRKKRKKDNEVLPEPSHCDAIVTNCDTEIEIEKEIELDIEKRDRDRDRINYQEIVNMYNDICISFPKVLKLSDVRKRTIRARLRTYSEDEIKQAFMMAEESDFLKGKNNRNWSANFDWIMNDGNMAKIIDGNYRNKKSELDESYDMIAEWEKERSEVNE